jgi:transcription initiation factor TFIIIB Brf1 subunit/transcription initiation factor TFIIB
MRCPKCYSKNVKLEDYLGQKVLVCLDCGYDESEKYEAYPVETSRKKGKVTPYKKGGHLRTR